MFEFTDDDHSLAKRFLQNPEQNFAAVYRRYAEPLYRFIFRFTGRRETSEEILHDVFLQLLNGKYGASGGDNLKAWLFTVARNKGLNHVTRTSKEQVPLSDDLTNGVNSEELLIEQNLLARMTVLESSLPADLLQTWRLRKDGLDYQQIAKQIEIPVGTVKSRFSRLVEFMKKELKDA